jgi:hypothetical protein
LAWWLAMEVLAEQQRTLAEIGWKRLPALAVE